jgi:hypothetical protein
VQVDLGEHGAAAVLADGGVVVTLGLPFDQDIADVEDDRLDVRAHSSTPYSASAWKAT